jgi:HD-GYP domain-containing protein (c-di-GMP phosphodiesterase class II)
MKTIRGKLLLVYGLFLIILIVSIYSSYVAIDAQHQHLVLNDIFLNQKLLIERISQNTVNVGNTAVVNLMYFDIQREENIDKIEDSIVELEIINNSIRNLQYEKDGEIIPLKFKGDFLVIFMEALEDFGENWDQSLETAKWLLNKENIESLNYENVLMKYKEYNESLFKHQDELIRLCREEAERNNRYAKTVEIISFIVSGLTFLFLIKTMEVSFKKPLYKIVDVFKKMGSGKMNVRLDRKENDEFKLVFNEFNRFSDNLAEVKHIEDEIIFKDNIYDIVSYMKEKFDKYIDLKSIDIFYSDSRNDNYMISYDGFEFDRKSIDQISIVEEVKHTDSEVCVPIMVNDRYIGYTRIISSSKIVDRNVEFIKNISYKINMAFYKSLLFNDLLSIVTNSLSDLAEYRDNETRQHLVRMSNYAYIIGEKLKEKDKYKDLIGKSYLDELKLAAPMHDIGKIGIPDEILLKPGKLTDEEFDIMKTHASIGAKVLEKMHDRFSKYNITYFNMAREIALYHQEKFNGSGYPNGVKGEEIPLSARICALADVFDALTSKRPYKEAFSLEKSYAIIDETVGSHFDPDVVEAFYEVREKIEEVYYKYRD